MIRLHVRALALLAVAALLLAGVVQGAPSRVEVVARGPQAQQPGVQDEDTAQAGTQVKPRAGRDHGFPADVIVHDENGHNDVVRVNVTVLKPDNSTVHRQAVDASKLSASGTRGTWRATVTMASNDTPGIYILRASVLDRDAAVTLAWTNFTYEPLAALTLAREQVSLLPNGTSSFAPGANTTATPVALNVTNGGNVNVSLAVSATALTNATSGESIPVSSLRASRLANMSSALTLATSDQTLGGSLAPNSTSPLYFAVTVPQGLRPGDYAGELTLTAVAAS